MRIACFGSSLLSAYWNGAATYYRGIFKALHSLGHRIEFYEPDAWGRQQHRDIEPPDYAQVVVYPPAWDAAAACLQAAAATADLLIKTSGVGLFEQELAAGVLQHRQPAQLVAFWDVDAPATLSELEADLTHPFRTLVPQYDLILTYGGGPPIIERYRRLGAREVLPIYNALDPETHQPEPADPTLAADLLFLGNRLPDREARVREFLLRPARELPQQRFLLGGNGWQEAELPANVQTLGHVYTYQHNRLNASVRMVLNIARDSMAATGWSPATRVFEAIGAGACLVTDAWAGLRDFFAPDTEILVARSGHEVAQLLRDIPAERARAIGQAGLARALRSHTYAQRAITLDAALRELAAGKLIIGN